MEVPSRRAPYLYLLVSLASLSIPLLTGCPAGTKTAVEIHGVVKIDGEHCKEDRQSQEAVNLSPELTLLDCTSGEVGGVVRIVFPRKSWYEVKEKAVDAGPGK
jgi:hypothetical protein